MPAEYDPSPNERIGTLAAEVMDWRDAEHPDADLQVLAVVIAVEDEDDELFVYSTAEGNRMEHIGLLSLALALLTEKDDD